MSIESKTAIYKNLKEILTCVTVAAKQVLLALAEDDVKRAEYIVTPVQLHWARTLRERAIYATGSKTPYPGVERKPRMAFEERETTELPIATAASSQRPWPPIPRDE